MYRGYREWFNTRHSSLKEKIRWINLYLLAGQAGVANAGYVQFAHLVMMDSQKCSI